MKTAFSLNYSALILSLIIVSGVTIDSGNDLLCAQDFSITYSDAIYQNTIKSVLFHRAGYELSYPVMELDGEDKLQLSFDELGNDVKTYNYTFVHCDADWRPTDIPVTDYIEGYTDTQIRTYFHSFNTTRDYVHYKLDFPNEDIAPKISGNYVLLVYKEFDKDQPVLTRRFYVVEQKVEIQAVVMRPKVNEYRDTGQEIDFSISEKGIHVQDPYSEIKVHLMQNYRHDNQITGLKPLFINDDVLDYSYDYENIFKGANEFRYLDIKSMRYQAEFIEDIKFENPYYHVYLYPSEPRTYKPYYFVNEINGKYYIDVQEARDKNIEADYVYVHFTLSVDAPVIEGNVYVFGALTDWNTNEDNKMIYNFETNSYELTLLLKQGYYNFMYAYVPDGSDVADPGYFEGDHYETENDYSIFVYYSDITSRYVRLIGYVKTNSLSNGTK